MSKVRTIRRFLRPKPREQVIPERFADYCEGGDMPPGLYQTRSQKFRYYFTSYPNLQAPSRSADDLDGTRTRFTHRSVSVAYNSIQEKLYKKLFDGSFDDAWFEQNDAFIRGLSNRHRYALAALTNKSQQHVQAFLKGGDLRPFCDRVRRWNTRVYGFLPVFFQLYPNENPTSTDYDDFVRNTCPTLPDKQILDAVGALVRDIRHVFRTCPRTTRAMTLWRGMRDQPDRQYAGFTATSINPLHALQYAGDECCLQRITILPKTPLVFVGGLSSFKKELECVLPDHTTFYELRRSATTIPTMPRIRQKCPTKTRRILIQNVAAVL